jgi:hypothetical protein
VSGAQVDGSGSGYEYTQAGLVGLKASTKKGIMTSLIDSAMVWKASAGSLLRLTK